MNNSKKSSAVDILATTACNIALDNNVDIFVCLTESGKIARYVAKYRPFQPILACTTSSSVVRQSNLSRGVIGYKIPSFLSKYISLCYNFIEKFSDKLINLVLKVAREQDLCTPGSKVLVFYTENEGKKDENVNFKLVEIKGE